MMASGRFNSGASRSILCTPAVKALFVQIVSFGLVLVCAFGISALVQAQLTVAFAAFLQGAIAALISRWRAMAPWWLLIQFLFPPAVVGLHAFHFPSWIFLVGFMALLALYWTTFRTQVPFYPSRPATWDMVAGLLPTGQEIRFIDIGSGFGGLVMRLSERRPESIFAGIEVAPLPWLTSLLRARIRGNKGQFIHGDYNQLNFADYDVVFAYLSPAAMPVLWQKAQAEMRQGTLLLSYEFPISGVAPHIVRYPVKGGAALYVWCL